MRAKILITSLVGWALLIVACSGGTASTADIEDIDPAVFKAAAEAVAADSTLALEDFPEGWTQEPPDDDDTDLGLSPDCAVLDQDSLPGEVTHSDSDNFVGPDEQEVTTGVSIFADVTGASEALDDYLATTDACMPELSASYDRVIREGLAADGVDMNTISGLVVTVEPRVSPVTADTTQAYRLEVTMTVSGQPLELIYDLVYARWGRVIGYLNYYQQGEPPSAEVATLSQALVNKLAVGDDELP